MSSSQGDKRSSDVEMGEATSQAPVPASSVEAPACVAGYLSFRGKLARRKAEKEPVRADTELPSSSALVVTSDHGAEVQAPQIAGTQVDASIPCVPDTSVQPTGSSTTLILVEDKEKAAESMPPPLARKDIVMALRAPSAAPVVQPKGRKRKFAKGGDGESSQQGGSNLAPGLRGKFVSLIDGMISECGSEVSRLARDLTKMQGKCFETEAMLKAMEGSHSAKVSKLEAEIGELERDLGKTASSLLTEKKARKAKSSEGLGLRDCRGRDGCSVASLSRDLDIGPRRFDRNQTAFVQIKRIDREQGGMSEMIRMDHGSMSINGSKDLEGLNRMKRTSWESCTIAGR
ncbi:hypothetical protein F2Q68_00034196 [Brassica cretica]|uniref:Uncharacterized protein n=1 Tax=Brassica cretica TaxID=69181 RepID=A0A8S9H5P5_BRACR|nr:hypothetical protein F2Q68_00034196 [Brassica cretica]